MWGQAPSPVQPSQARRESSQASPVRPAAEPPNLAITDRPFRLGPGHEQNTPRTQHATRANSQDAWTTVEERPFRAAFSAKRKRGFSPRPFVVVRRGVVEFESERTDRKPNASARYPCNLAPVAEPGQPMEGSFRIAPSNGQMKTLFLCLLLSCAAFATAQTTHTCKFTRGPLQGQTHTLPNRNPTTVGSSCSDGLTSTGIAVPDPSSDTGSSSEQMSHTCKFNRGPLQGQTQTLPNRNPTPVGSTCSDGLTSSGITVPDSATSSDRTSHTCKFNRGPLQGQTQTLPNRNATKVGSTCSDGLTSSGIAVPDPS
jgi:hypothetical protein